MDDGKIYWKALYLMVKTMVSCKFSLCLSCMFQSVASEIQSAESPFPTGHPGMKGTIRS